MQKLTIFCDGGARGNPGLAAAAFVVYDEKGTELYSQAVFLGQGTNNQAEYQGVIAAMEWLSKQSGPVNAILFKLDSLLVVNQLKGLYKIKQAHLVQLAANVKNLERALKVRWTTDIDFQHVAREQNARADFLLNQVLDQQ